MGEKKKIMLITPMLHQGGFERVCVMTARLLQKEYEVIIAVFSMEDIAFDVSGLCVLDLNLKSKKGRLGKLVNVYRRARKLTRLQKKYGIDVSYSFGTTANIANALSRGAKKKLTACHSFEEIKDTGYMKLISRHSDTVICCSRKMTELVKTSYAFENVTTLWNPCDTAGIIRQAADSMGADGTFFKGKEKILVAMGREDDVKGFWHLLKAFRRIYETDSHIGLTIIGEGNFEEYKHLARELEIDEQVLFTGLKKNPFPYLKAAHVYLLTSISEGLPNALVEALAVSLPVVSVNCLSGPAEILHENWQEAEKQEENFQADYGILTPVLTPHKNLQVSWEVAGEEKRIVLEPSEEKLAQAVLGLLKDETLYSHYQERASERAEAFSTEKYLQALKTCIEGL